MQRFASAVLPLSLLLSLTACGDDDKDDAAASLPPAAAAKAELAIADYKKVVNANYDEVLAFAKALQVAIDAFVLAPSEATHKAAKDAWIAARAPYGPSEAFRFYEGPIDNAETGPEGAINAWPLDENYIDYVREQPTAGLINDTSKPLTLELIADANEKGGEKAISTGYHAIEFLLWGQDDDVATNAQGTTAGAGKRPFTDYLTTGGTAANQDRRAQYLKLVTQLLIEDLQSVADAWKPGVPGNFAATFGITVSEGDAKGTAIGDLLASIGSMAKAELSGERMSVAYKNKGQEDEHSCFSDNTAPDLLGNGVGIQNVWLGHYGSFEGVGIDEVLGAVDPALSAKMTADLAASVAKLKALVDLQNAGKPIDVVIAAVDGSPERSAMLEAIQALKLVGTDVEAASTKLGLKIVLEEPSEAL